MSARITGGPAFPSSGPDHNPIGMSLRDYFAAHLQVGDCDQISTGAAEALSGPMPSYKDDPIAYLNWEADWLAKIKFIRADAMLTARGAA